MKKYCNKKLRGLPLAFHYRARPRDFNFKLWEYCNRKLRGLLLAFHYHQARPGHFRPPRCAKHLVWRTSGKKVSVWTKSQIISDVSACVVTFLVSCREGWPSLERNFYLCWKSLRLKRLKRFHEDLSVTLGPIYPGQRSQSPCTVNTFWKVSVWGKARLFSSLTKQAGFMR